MVIAPEMIHSARIIPVDGRPHVTKNIKLWLGDTRGHWEGNTLVLETDNFRPDTGTRYTTHLTERFTRVSQDRINYEYTVNDPTQFTKPWKVAGFFGRVAKDAPEPLEYACAETSRALLSIFGKPPGR